MVSMDDTQPHRPVRPNPPPYAAPPDDDSSGPGCLVWGLMGLLSLGLALVVVLLAGFAGWTDGLRVARANATATRSADVLTQCSFIAEDIAANRTGLLQRRLDDLLRVTPVPDCLQLIIPTATAIYRQNLPTVTPTATLTATATPTLPPTLTPAAPVATATGAAAPAAGEFDPAPLLVDAQTQITAGDYRAAVESLEAITAIDPNFEKPTVDRLLYQALTAEATRLYRTGGNLAEAILLTNRAEEYGDVGELNFERSVAALYLDAQAALNTNYPLAIRLLSQLVALAPNYRNAGAQLFDQYEKYGDALGLTGDACGAQRQYEAALTLQQPEALRLKRDTAAQACLLGVPPTTDPALNPGAGATPDPNLPAQPPTPASSAVAPIGQPGG
ncbi:MAG: hypothetical protein MUE40_15690 [Anaerolineae bacterium]|nr:hypothetical protein [Anaerolineae bacterium]